MKIFISIRQSFAIVGFDPNRRPFNRIVKFFCVSFVIILTISFIFLFNDASTFKEFTDTAYTMSSIGLMAFVYVVGITKIAEIHKLLDDFERVFNERKLLRSVNLVIVQKGVQYFKLTHSLLGLNISSSKETYEKANRLIEKVSSVLIIVIAWITPTLWIWPKCLGCFYAYFNSDLGNEVFEMPMAIWYIILNMILKSFKIEIFMQFG